MNSSTKDIYVKHNLGKIIFFLIGVLSLQAEDFSYSFDVDNTSPYVKEPVILTLELNQSNPNMVLLFNFDLVKSKSYTFQRVDSKETDIHETQGLHHAKVKYVYLIYPLNSGKIDLNFKLLKKVTTDESVAYSFSGDRDNVKTLVTTDTQISLPSLKLDVKPLPKGTQIVGDFTLEYHLKNLKAKAYEPLPFQVTLKGAGYPPMLTLFQKDVNFTLFTEKPLHTSVASLKGTSNTVQYPMALSHSADFTLPKLTIKAFNPKSKKSYELTVPEQKFDISQVDKNTLVDKVNNPKLLKQDWSWLTTLLTYLLVFLAGYLTALSWKWTKKVQIKKDNPLKEKIQNAKDEKALLQLLMANDSHRFAIGIQKLEDSLYGNGKIKLSKVKEEAMDLI